MERRDGAGFAPVDEVGRQELDVGERNTGGLRDLEERLGRFRYLEVVGEGGT